jgi:multimeric flavodoxin WrbA
MRRSGAVQVLDSMNHFFLANQMIVAGRAVGVGNHKGEVQQDEEGMGMARSLGQRMAWVLQRLRG